MAGSRLGRGVEALIPKEKNISDKENIKYVEINKVTPKKDQPRKKFDEDKLIELAESIKQHGIIEPIIVADNGKYYEIIAGERRWRAAKKAKLSEVPIIIKALGEKEILELSLIENIQREDLNPIEEAMAYDMLVNKFHMKQDEIAEKVSKSRTVITNSLRMLKLSEEVQRMVIDEKLTVGHARTLITIDDKDKQCALANQIFDEGLTVRETEQLVKKITSDKSKPINKSKKLKNQAYFDQLQINLMDYLHSKVEINRKNDKRGKIEIEYFSDEDLDRLLSLIMK